MMIFTLLLSGFAIASGPAISPPAVLRLVQTTSDQSRIGQRWLGRRGEGRTASGNWRDGNTTAMTRAQRLTYGSNAAQRVLYWSATPAERARPPIAIYVHGGGWAHGQPEMVAAKPEFFNGHGWAFASIGYRLLPDAPVEEQAADVGRAIRMLRMEAARLGFDPDRILLFGHSAGAHLAALVATDPDYAGDAFAAIRGVIPVDGACYDVAAQMALGGLMARRTYIPAFGTDPARQRALSPTTHAGGRDVPDWLLLYSSARDDAREQSAMLAAAVRSAGARVEQVEVPARVNRALIGHMEINRDFGTAQFAAAQPVLAMMRRIEATQ